MRTFTCTKSFIWNADAASALKCIGSTVPRYSCWKCKRSAQLHTRPCLSSVSMSPKYRGVSGHSVSHKLSLVCGPRLPQTYGLPQRVPDLMAAPLLRHMSSRPSLPFDPESIPLSEEERITLAKAEYELYKAEGEIEIPSQLEEKEFKTLALLPDIMERRKHLRFLYIKETNALERKKLRAENEKRMQEIYVKVAEELKTEAGRLVYGLWRNTMFISYSAHRMNSFYAHRVFHAKFYGQPIVFDYGFDSFMNVTEKRGLGAELGMSIGVNRTSIDPYYFHVCNFRKDEEVVTETLIKIPTLLDEDYPVDTHSEDFLDLFPKQKLVYITPHCREELLEYDHDAIYIIGGLVKYTSMEPVILAKAKKLKIKMRKLPIDRYVNWGACKKSLPLNITVGILLEVKHSGDWAKAFNKHIPKWMLAKEDESDVDHFKKPNRNKKTLRLRVRSIFEE